MVLVAVDLVRCRLLPKVFGVSGCESEPSVGGVSSLQWVARVRGMHMASGWEPMPECNDLGSIMFL